MVSYRRYIVLFITSSISVVILNGLSIFAGSQVSYTKLIILYIPLLFVFLFTPLALGLLEERNSVVKYTIPFHLREETSKLRLTETSQKALSIATISTLWVIKTNIFVLMYENLSTNLVIGLIITYLASLFIRARREIEKIKGKKAPERLQERVKELSQRLDIEKPDVYVNSTNNSFAHRSLSNRYITIGDRLFLNLDEKEIDAVILHELSHLKQKNRNIKIITILPYICGIFLVLFFPNGNMYSITSVILITFIATHLGISKIRRRQELDADRLASEYIEPIYQARALIKMTNLKHINDNTGPSRLLNYFSYYPTTQSRMENLVDEETIEEIIAQDEDTHL